MRAALALVLATAFLCLNPIFVHAEDPVVVDLRIDAPAVVTVGDRVGYTIVAEVDEGTSITLAPAGLPAEVALVDAPVTTRMALDKGREQVTISFQVAPFATGELLLPPLPLRYSSPDGSSGTIETGSSVIEVTSVLPATGQVTPRDLKPQAEVGKSPATWPLPVLVALVSVLALLSVTVLVRRRVVQRRVARALRRVVVVTGPEDVAREALDAAGAEFSTSGDFVSYYTALGNAVRDYLTHRFGFPAFALTTRELENAMLRLGLDRWQVRVASGLLEQCDAVVYARYRPAAERADADLTAAYEVVEMSRPEERTQTDREEVGVP